MAFRLDLEFRVRTARLGNDSALLSVTGELDLDTLPEFGAALAGLGGAAAQGLILDLTDVTFLDSTALAALVAEARERRADGRRLVVVCDNRNTLRTLEVTGLLPFFRVEPSLREAVAKELAESAA